MTINAIQDAIKALAQTLNVATIFPAALFVLVHVYWILPQLWPEADFVSVPAFTFSISVTLILSYTLYAFNFPLTRVIEGYKGRALPVVKDILADLRAEKKNQLKQLKDQIFELANSNDPARDLELAAEEYCLEREFPGNENSVLPTRVGNTIAAFEYYPQVRYKMDSIALWPRLVPILHKRNFLDFVIQEKTIFDFLLNMFVVVITLGLEIFYLSLCLGPGYWLAAVISLAITAIAGIIFYEGLVIAARQWGTTVRVAFDLYRDDLYLELGLEPAPTFQEERKRWEQISEFLLSRRNNEEFRGFLAQADRLKRKQATQAAAKSEGKSHT